MCFGRRAVHRTIVRSLPEFSGTLLDVGCGSQPYRRLMTTPPSRVSAYVGVDIVGPTYAPPDVYWDGFSLPIRSAAVDTAVATEVLEHCPEPGKVIAEVARTLRPGGLFLFTVPFLWPLHNAPNDEYRYTPYALERMLQGAGFTTISIEALGGWDASLAQMLGLWVRRRPMSRRRRHLLSSVLLPVVRRLADRDVPPAAFGSDVMFSALVGRARK